MIPAFCARGAVEITPSDTKAFAKVHPGFRVDVGGTVRFLDGEGREHTWMLADGAREAIEVQQIFASGTSATGICVFTR